MSSCFFLCSLSFYFSQKHSCHPWHKSVRKFKIIFSMITLKRLWDVAAADKKFLVTLKRRKWANIPICPDQQPVVCRWAREKEQGASGQKGNIVSFSSWINNILYLFIISWVHTIEKQKRLTSFQWLCFTVPHPPRSWTASPAKPAQKGTAPEWSSR